MLKCGSVALERSLQRLDERAHHTQGVGRPHTLHTLFDPTAACMEPPAARAVHVLEPQVPATSRGASEGRSATAAERQQQPRVSASRAPLEATPTPAAHAPRLAPQERTIRRIAVVGVASACSASVERSQPHSYVTIHRSTRMTRGRAAAVDAISTSDFWFLGSGGRKVSVRSRKSEVK